VISFLAQYDIYIYIHTHLGAFYTENAPTLVCNLVRVCSCARASVRVQPGGVCARQCACATWCVCVCARVYIYWLSHVIPVATRIQRRLQPQHTQSCNLLYVYIAPGCILYIECTQAGEQTGHAHTPGRVHNSPHHPRTHLVRPTPHTPRRAAHTRSCPPVTHTLLQPEHNGGCNHNTHRVAIDAFSTENMLHTP
jgi:hypothetical protein